VLFKHDDKNVIKEGLYLEYAENMRNFDVGSVGRDVKFRWFLVTIFPILSQSFALKRAGKFK
jgi:hypothetical protein